MILQKLISTKKLFAAQGGALCKNNSADSGQLMQNYTLLGIPWRTLKP